MIMDFINRHKKDDGDLSIPPLQIVRKARGSEILRDRQRIFLCWHPKNIVARDILLKDLLSHDAGVDCVVSYRENPENNMDEASFGQELHETQLMVLLVSQEFLVQAKIEKPPEYRMAKEIKLPILPIALDAGILPKFTMQEGAVHCIAVTDPEYRTKLKMQLENFIISNELMQEIAEKAFTAGLFLSYRKKDIALARKFMHEFHHIRGFESISIWYDNFLTAGRVFDEEIRNAISRTDLFVLLVTQHIAESGNYVLEEEYPYAKKCGKRIVAVEMQTPGDNFNKEYPAVDYYAKPEDIRSVFQMTLPENVLQSSIDPERSYLLGMAFLHGVIVEKDYKLAIDLLTSASNRDNLRAARKLGDIHFGNANYPEALQMYEQAVMLSEKTSGMMNAQTAELYTCIAECYHYRGDSRAAWEMYSMALMVYMRVSGMESLPVIKVQVKLGWLYNDAQDYEPALERYRFAMQNAEKLFGPEQVELVEIYNGIAGIYYNMEDYEQALQMHLKVLTVCEKFFGIDHPNAVLTFNHIANVYNSLGNYSQAMEMCRKSLSGCKKLFGDEHPATANSYSTLGNIYYNLKDFTSAADQLLKAYKIRMHYFGRSHDLTKKIHLKLLTIYSMSGRKEDFGAWLDSMLYE
jgi:tetratricopeptide (TPR) repeat protein